MYLLLSITAEPQTIREVLGGEEVNLILIVLYKINFVLSSRRFNLQSFNMQDCNCLYVNTQL